MKNLKQDYNSTVNQSIKEKFVRREVVQNVNELMQHLIQSEDKGDYYDEIMNVCSTPDYENAAEYEGWILNEDTEQYEKEGEENTYETAQEVCENENIDYDYIEAYEFWSVTDYLAKKLEEKGEMVEEIFGLNVWGRCTTGQAILLDHVISVICEDMEILQGQKYSWED